MQSFIWYDKQNYDLGTIVSQEMSVVQSTLAENHITKS